MSGAAIESRLSEAPSVQAARRALEGEEAWIVGGAVRDAALDRPVADLDIAVAPGREAEAAAALARESGGARFRLASEPATWRVLAADGGWHVDVVGLRDGDIDADLAGRDFTINALGVPLAGGDPVDPGAGLRDLEQGVLRVVAEGAFEDDPLRVLRAARFAADPGLEIEPATLELARSAAERLGEVAGERQYAELRRIVAGPAPLAGVDAMHEVGATAVVLPELEALRGVRQSPNHHLDVHDHTIAVFENWLAVERDLERYAGERAADVAALFAEPLADDVDRGTGIRFACLLHDVGKPATREERGGYATFIGHDRVGAEMIEVLCRRLRTSAALLRFVQQLTLHHLRLGFLTHQRPLSRRQVHDYLRATDPVAVEVTLLTVADRLAARGEGPLASEEAIQAHLDLAREMIAAGLDWRREGPPRPPLPGDELAAELGIEPGPQLGRLLAEIEAAQYAGEVSDRDEAVALARKLLD